MARRYDPFPSYPARGGRVERGLPPRPRGVLAIEARPRSTGSACSPRCPAGRAVDVRGFHPPWSEVERRTSDGATDDPVFRRLWSGSLADLFGELPRVEEGTIVFGPGSALVAHDELWYADVPKRLALAAVATARRRTSASARARVARSSGCSRGLADARPPQAGAAPADRPLHRLSPIPRHRSGSRATRSAERSPTSPVGPFARVPPSCPGRGGVVGSSASSAWSERAEPRLVVRAHRTRGDAARRRARSRARAPAGCRERGDPRPRGRLALRSASSRFGSTTSTRSRADTSRSSAIRPSSTRARPSASRTRSTRPTTSCRRPPARRSSSACARTPTWTPSNATRARRSRAGRSTRLATSSCTMPSSIGSTRSRQARRTRAERATSCSRSARRPTSTRLRFYDWLRRDLEGTLRPVHLEHAFANLDPGAGGSGHPRPRRGTDRRPLGSRLGRARARPAARAVLRRAPARLRRHRGGRHRTGGSTCSTWSRARRWSSSRRRATRTSSPMRRP